MSEHCPAHGCKWSTTGGIDSLRCRRPNCPGAAGQQVKENHALATHLSMCLVGEDHEAAARAWRARVEGLTGMVDELQAMLRSAAWTIASMQRQLTDLSAAVGALRDHPRDAGEEPFPVLASMRYDSVRAPRRKNG